LSIANVTQWNIYILELLFAYPNMGVAIRSGTPYTIELPTVDDLFPNTRIRMYSYRTDGVTLDNESRKDFVNATNIYSKLEAKRKEEEAKVCALLTSSYSEEAKIQLRTNRPYIEAANNNDSFLMFTIARQPTLVPLASPWPNTPSCNSSNSR
jgi:hypothetical protein